MLLQLTKAERKNNGTIYKALTARLGVTEAAPKISKRSRAASWPGIWGRLGVKRRSTRTQHVARKKTTTDVWQVLDERLDPAKLRPKLAEGLEIKHFQARTGDYMMICNTKELTHFRFEPGDAELIELMDGTRSVEEIVLDRLEESGEIELSGVADLVLTLYEGNLLDRNYIDAEQAVKFAIHPGGSRRFKRREALRTLTFQFGSPQRLVKSLYDRGLKYLFNPWVNVVMGGASIAGFIAFLILVHRRTFAIAGSSLAAEGVILLSLNYFLTFAHEVGHALVIVRHGRRVKSAGFQIYFGSPAWFVDSTDALMMDPKYRMASSFAGPYADMFLAGVASLVLFLIPHVAIGRLLYKFIALNYFLIFLNLIPLLELDGYFILSEYLRMPDLRPRSLSFLRNDVFRKLRAHERFHANEVGLLLYGVFGVLFSVLALYTGALYWKQLFGGFVSAMWHGGLATRVILLLLAVFVGGPLIRGIISLIRFLVRRIRTAWRALIFRFETAWRVEAAELIDALPIFDDVPEDTLNELAGRVKLRALAQGQVAVRQGERAEAFYVVRKGRLEVYETEPVTLKETQLRVLGRGEAFGELAVVRASVRTASVRALEDSELFEIDRSTFQRLLGDMVEMPDYVATVQQITELGELRSFQHLEPDELAELLEYGEWMQYAPGEAIVKQGETADAFYTIGSGQVDIVAGRKVLNTLGPGNHFGEMGLLRRAKRSATCRARTPVRAYRLTKKGFDRLMRDSFRKGTLNPAASADRKRQH